MITSQKKILVTGASGQLGVELTQALVTRFGSDSVIATDIDKNASGRLDFCSFRKLDVLDNQKIKEILDEERFTQVYHLAAILSANGEAKPFLTWDVNMSGLLLILDFAKTYGFKVFCPSSIAVFGKGTPLKNTPQNAFGIPTTVYGISKQAGEQWCNYYHDRFGVDVRSVRYPGLIGYKTLPGGGTTDYAVDIFHKAIAGEKYNCFLTEDTKLPMMYMPDAIDATLGIMLANPENLSNRTSYNIAGMSFTPKELFKEIKKHIENFDIEYHPDYRQQIAESWPSEIDDQIARTDWGWNPKYNLESMVNDMLMKLAVVLK